MLHKCESQYERIALEKLLRAQDFIQDDPLILKQLGHDGVIPPISQELLEQSARTNCAIVLKFPTTLIELESRMRESAVAIIDRGAKSLEIDIDKPEWMLVPHSVNEDSLGSLKEDLLERVPPGAFRHPMDTILMVAYYHQNKGRGNPMPGFEGKSTMTSQPNLVVGSSVRGLQVMVRDQFDLVSFPDIGLAYSPV